MFNPESGGLDQGEQGNETGDYKAKIEATVREMSSERLNKAVEDGELSVGELPTAGPGDGAEGFDNGAILEILKTEKAARESGETA